MFTRLQFKEVHSLFRGGGGTFGAQVVFWQIQIVARCVCLRDIRQGGRQRDEQSEPWGEPGPSLFPSCYDPT